MAQLSARPKWTELPFGSSIPEPGTARNCKTGTWRSARPEWNHAECVGQSALIFAQTAGRGVASSSPSFAPLAHWAQFARVAIIVSAQGVPTNFWGNPVTASAVKEIAMTQCSRIWETLKRKYSFTSAIVYAPPFF